MDTRGDLEVFEDIEVLVRTQPAFLKLEAMVQSGRYPELVEIYIGMRDAREQLILRSRSRPQPRSEAQERPQQQVARDGETP